MTNITKQTSISVGLIAIILPAVIYTAVAWTRVEAQTNQNTTDIAGQDQKLDLLLDMQNENRERLIRIEEQVKRGNE